MSQVDIISIGSSSSGNSYIIKAGGRVILLDVGLTAKKITGALSEHGISPEDVEAVLITHEHIDHVRSVRAVSRKCCNAVFFATGGTVRSTANFAYVPEDRLRIVQAGDTIMLDEQVQICVFGISHDAAEPVSYTVSCGGEKLAVVTDTGIITDEIYEAISDAGKLVFESNHDEDLLMYGEYPYPVKVRIKSDHGHLSNRYAGEILARILRDRRNTESSVLNPDGNFAYSCSESESDAEEIHSCGVSEEQTGTGCTAGSGGRPLEIMLAHLSFHNNAPFYARNTIEPILRESGFVRDEDYTLTIAARDEITVL